MPVRSNLVLLAFVACCATSSARAPDSDHSPVSHCQSKEEQCSAFKSVIVALNRSGVAKKYSCSDLSRYLPGDVGYRNKDRVYRLGRGKFLFEILCGSGAYNANYIYFFFEPERRVHAQSSSRALEIPMVVFPTREHEIWNLLTQAHSQSKHWPDLSVGPARIEYTPKVWSRHFAPETSILYVQRITTGTGHSGHYAQYYLDPTTGVPELLESYTRVVDDYSAANAYDFDIANPYPKSTEWVRYKPRSRVRGCLVNIKDSSCTGRSNP